MTDIPRDYNAHPDTPGTEVDKPGMDDDVCMCGEKMGTGGSICAHGGCVSMTEYYGRTTAILEPMLLLDVSVDEGKYTVQQTAEGAMHVLRYGEPWKLNVFDNCLLAFAYEVDALRDQLARHRQP